MAANIQDFSQELLTTTSECISLSKQYLQARKDHAHWYNKLIVLLKKTGIEKSKKSIDNKIIELLSDKDYGELAEEYYTQMLQAEAEYKGLDNVTKAYQNHSMALMSVQKFMLSGEIAQATKQKYGVFNAEC